MRSFISITVRIVFVLLFGSSAFAADARLIRYCTANSVDTVEHDRKVFACTQLLADKSLVAKKGNRSVLLNNRGGAWTMKNDFSKAIADFDETLKLDPTNIGALGGRASARLRKRDIDGALADLNFANRLAPKDMFVYAVRAQVWTETGDNNLALKDYGTAIELNPKFSQLYVARALVWRNLGQFDQALEDLNTSIKKDAANASAFSMRGEIWRLKGDLVQALVDQTKAIQLRPKLLYGYVRRADTFRYKGELKNAFDDYTKALALDPNLMTALVGTALTFEKSGNLEQARLYFEKTINSPTEYRTDDQNAAFETAQARLSALESGVLPPIILSAPSKAQNGAAIPTPPVVARSSMQLTTGTKGRRIALVIGNAAYKNVSALNNPIKDSEAIAASLRNIGFETVTLTNDATREKLIESLRAFANEAEHAEWAMVYYAGHGMEVNGVNYLIPIDAKLAVDRDIEFEAVPLSQILRATDPAKKIKLIVLDACRDNPFTPRKTAAPEQVASVTAGGAIGTRSTNGRGLAEVKVQGATLVVYAAKDGQVALDGEGGNSPFAVAVVQRLATPGVEINKLFRLVRDDVMEATAGRQEPYTYGSLPGKEDFFFVSK